MNLFHLIRKSIPAVDSPFIEDLDNRSLTYGDMLTRSGQMANVLTARGLKPGDRVAVQVDKSIDNLMLYLGALRAGVIYLPLNTAYTPTELDYFVSDAKPALIVCDPKRRDTIVEMAHRNGISWVETLDARGKGTLSEAAADLGPDFADIERSKGDLAAILYTSGTTGRSKGAMLTHGNLSSNARTLKEYWRFTSKDVLIHALPIFHTHGLFVACNTLMMAGGSMIFMQKFDADRIIDLLPRATSMMAVPTFYTRLLNNAALTKEACSGFRLFTSGSAPLLSETHLEFKRRTGHAILERYGMTETNITTSNPYEGERIAGTVGVPLPDIDLRIVDPDSGRQLPHGEAGIIEVRGPCVFSGYWGLPEKTKAEFRPDGFFVTGDIGRFDAKGYLTIVGRAKDLIISGGFNVYPAEVEAEIDALAGVVESAVIGCPHPDFGESVTAIVIRQLDCTLTEEDVLNHLQGRLAKFKVPKKVIFVSELPRNTMGKVQKNILREQNKDLYQ
ncbi:MULTISPECIES: malonyl-CoA synthase [unclassified Bradyrhizobium]|uniref:malonate--CoA ligase n=1 Tax=unclassified Bradyrhizobium TaxID=2631580 RepID=UPI0024799AED|nr:MULTISPECIES: malonyl-CoA synthase [unclassified Bradyrhizobium]WGR73140.1 malonyl-CoA synthase [Bradyrhizobium sp. ISRA426]WGR77980.1 malonyl-CoA synthase [Bradyrhizobium sp. ISRA430]WGR88381.1 malonyl-CoA synthase [Bradyrhizobium sp. ISRA432]